MERGVRGGFPRTASRQWISGCPCCERLWNEITNGWTRFWPRWTSMQRGKGNDDYDWTDSQDRRRYSYRSGAAFRFASRSRVPRASRTETTAEMAARARGMDHAGLYQ